MSGVLESVAVVLSIAGVIMGAAWKLSERLTRIETSLETLGERVASLEPVQILRPKAKSRP